MASGLPVADTPTTELIRLMTGRNVEHVFPPRRDVPADAPVVLEVDGLALRGTFSDVSFTVRAGEVVGLAGLVGSGRSEIVETVYGARKATSGTVVDRRHAMLRPGSVRDAVNKRHRPLPRRAQEPGPAARGARLQERDPVVASRDSRGRRCSTSAASAASSREQIEALELRPADPDRATGTLSGGNQQKILLARWLVHGTKVLLLDEPTRGVDVGARTEIYQLIRRLADAGTAIVVVSSEIEEVLGLSDRVLVIADGRVIQTTARHRHRRARRARPHHGRRRRVSEQTPTPAPATVNPRRRRDRSARSAASSAAVVGRNLGLVIALLLIVVVGAITAGRPLPRRRQRAHHPAVRVDHRRDQHRDDLRHHRRRHRPVGRLGDGARDRRRDPRRRVQAAADSSSWLLMVLIAIVVGARGRVRQRHRHRLRAGGALHGDPRHARRARADSPSCSRTSRPRSSTSSTFKEFFRGDLLGIDPG